MVRGVAIWGNVANAFTALVEEFSECLNLGSARFAITTNHLFVYILQTISIGLMYQVYFLLGTYLAVTKSMCQDTVRRNLIQLINITSIQSVICLYSFRICFGMLVTGVITWSTFLLTVFPFNAYIVGLYIPSANFTSYLVIGIHFTMLLPIICSSFFVLMLMNITLNRHAFLAWTTLLFVYLVRFFLTDATRLNTPTFEGRPTRLDVSV